MAKPLPDFLALPVKIERKVEHSTPMWIGAAAGLASFIVVSIWFDLDLKLDLIIFMAVWAAVWAVVGYLFSQNYPDHEETVTIHQDHVEVTRTGKFGDVQWTAPVASFRCVLWKRCTKHYLKPKSVWHVIEMTHSDPSKSIVLHAGYDKFEAQDLWSQAAEKLKLPQEKKDVRDTYGGDYIYLQADDVGQGGNGDNGDGGGNGGE